MMADTLSGHSSHVQLLCFPRFPESLKPPCKEAQFPSRDKQGAQREEETCQVTWLVKAPSTGGWNAAVQGHRAQAHRPSGHCFSSARRDSERQELEEGEAEIQGAGGGPGEKGGARFPPEPKPQPCALAARWLDWPPAAPS